MTRSYIAAFVLKTRPARDIFVLLCITIPAATARIEGRKPGKGEAVAAGKMWEASELFSHIAMKQFFLLDLRFNKLQGA